MLAEAADTLASHKQALQLRYLQTLTEVATEGTNTIIFPAADGSARTVPGVGESGRVDADTLTDLSTATQDSRLTACQRSSMLFQRQLPATSTPLVVESRFSSSPKTPRELVVRGTQRFLRIDTEMPGQVCGHGEQQVAQFFGDYRTVIAVFTLAASSSAAIPRRFLRARRSASGQSKPTPAARLPSFSARSRAGRAQATPSRTPAERAVFPGSLFTLACLCASQAALWAAAAWRFPRRRTRAGDAAASCRLIAATTSPKSNACRSAGHLGMKHDLQQQVAEFVLADPSRSPRSIASATS